MWTDEDRDIAVALALIDAERCSGCGHPVAESTDPANEYSYSVTLTRCHACVAVERETRIFAESNMVEGSVRPGALAGLFTSVTRDDGR